MLARVTPLMVQGVQVPPFMFGTAWKEAQTEAVTRLALEAGFRAIDTANQRKHYFEAGVGAALRDSQIPRSELFLQTKFTSLDGQDHRLPYDAHADVATQVQQSFASSLEHLGVDHLDSFVLHGPTSRHGWNSTDAAIWAAMESLQTAARTRLIGVSNVTSAQLGALCKTAVVPPAFVQNRCYARTGWDREVRAFCRDNGIIYQGFSLLTANQRELATPLVAAIAARRSLTVPQVVFAFARAVGMLPLTGTQDPTHMRQDLASVGIVLDPVEVAAIERASS
jgi:diketogulonate reductase-like aldo/keto reductase